MTIGDSSRAKGLLRSRVLLDVCNAGTLRDDESLLPVWCLVGAATIESSISAKLSGSCDDFCGCTVVSTLTSFS